MGGLTRPLIILQQSAYRSSIEIGNSGIQISTIAVWWLNSSYGTMRGISMLLSQCNYYVLCHPKSMISSLNSWPWKQSQCHPTNLQGQFPNRSSHKTGWECQRQRQNEKNKEVKRKGRAVQPTVRVPKMAHTKISLEQGIHYCPNVCISFVRPSSPYCAQCVYTYTHICVQTVGYTN